MKKLANFRMILTIILVITGMYLSSINAYAAIICYFAAVWIIPIKLSAYVLSFKSIAAIVLIIFAARERIYNQPVNNGSLTVTYIDVGQGDSALVQLPDNKTILIDAGTAEQGGTVVNTLKSLGITRIDHIIGTHPHADHIGGIPEVIANFQIGDYLEPETGEFPWPDSYCSYHLSDVLKQKRISTIKAYSGLIIEENDNYIVEVISPQLNMLFEDLNDYSVIIKITFGKTSFLFTGDAGYNAELELLENDLKCDVLKIGHHGSFGSTCSAFLNATDPIIAVISVGKENDNNLPNDYVLERLNEEGIQTLRTDEKGTITIQSDGNSVSIINP